MIGYAHVRELEFEVRAVEGKLDEVLAMHAFASAYTSQVINLHVHNRFPMRFGGRRLGRLSQVSLPYTAMGVLLGLPQAVNMARMQLAAYRRGDYLSPGVYPIYEFVLSLLRDYLDEPPLGRDDAVRVDETILLNLLERWRNPDPQELVAVLLDACDFHTQRCKTGKGTQYYEFESLHWTRTPFEILLVMKLRQKLGLQNPDLDHPLMNTALGVLPNEVPFAPDDLIARVRARMMQDGYDEQAIFRAVLADA